MTVRRADTDHPIHALLVERHSPYVFADRAVTDEDLVSLFEAARWAASSYNEQPWRYVVAAQDDEDAFARLLSCLVDANQAWARTAPVLALGLVSNRFSRNGKENKAAWHDLGQASASLSFEATARGLVVHQMIGILPDRAHEVYGIPEGFEAVTALAIGYHGDEDGADPKLAERDRAPRTRRPVSEFVFGDAFGRKHLRIG